MHNVENPTIQHPARGYKKPNSSILLALALALIVHVLVLLAPLSSDVQDSGRSAARIEIQLTAFAPPKQVEEIVEPEPISKPVPEPPPVPEPAEEPVTMPLEKMVENMASTQPTPLLKPINRDIEQMNHEQKTQLTHSILSRQFISEPGAAEQVFGKPLPSLQADPIAEFHYPMRENMIAMLDKPMQDLPFEYREGLVYFAYEPGIKGDLQKFWDDITPEFGWITRYGTEVRCVWVLVIAACGWK